MKKLFAHFLQIVGLLTILGALVGGGLVASAGIWLKMDDELKPADAIVILSGELRRAIHAADLYHQGLAPVIYVSRARHNPPQALEELGFVYPRQEDDMQRVLAAKGVPPEAIRLYGHDLISTVEEGEALRTELGNGPHHLIIVTSPYHCRRAKLILSGILTGDELLMSATPYERFEAAWWRDQDSARAVVQEAAKFLFYFAGTPFRSKPATVI